MSDKTIGFDACIDAIGRDFYEAHKDNSVFACSNEDKGQWCFLGINTTEHNDEGLKLTHDKNWEYSASCFVKDGVVQLDEVHAPEVV